jgi:UDP-N-acetylglucosamine 2-epimerase (non-hydrolysing)
MKIATVIGTRPEIVKMSRLVPLLDKNFEHTFVFSDQHYSKNMVEVFFQELGLRKPDIHLDVRSSDHSALIPPMIRKLKEVDPDFVVVYGDTNSTLAAALAAVKLGKKVAHVEAGLRSYDRRMIEEVNRILTDHVSDVLFTPTDYTKVLLEKEGLVNNVFVVGNTVVDAVRHFMPQIEKNDILRKLGVNGRFVLLTLHRQELVDCEADLSDVLRGIGSIEGTVLFPIHPRTEKRLQEFGIKLPSNVRTIPPQGYFEFMKLMKEAAMVMTDSGGVQEEAVSLKTPCVTMMLATERMETVAAGANVLVGYDADSIKTEAKRVLDQGVKEKMKSLKNPYGEGDASEMIVRTLKSLSTGSS